MQETLRQLASRLGVPDGDIVTADEFFGWEDGLRKELLAEGVLRQTENAKKVTCLECGQGCFIEPETRTDPEIGKAVGIYMCSENPEIGRFEVDLNRLRCWKIVKAKLVELGYYREKEIPASTDKPPYVFRKQGDMWEVTYKGKATNVKHQKGMLYIEHLLRNAKRQFKPLELKQIIDPPETVIPLGNVNPISEDDSAKKQEGMGYIEANAIADRDALKGYYDRFKQIDVELEEARCNSDQATEDKLSKEKDAILQQMRSSKAIRGQLRQFSGNEAKVKGTISTAIRRAIDSIKEHNEDLSEHLDSNVNRGSPFCYSSEPEVDWHFE